MKSKRERESDGSRPAKKSSETILFAVPVVTKSNQARAFFCRCLRLLPCWTDSLISFPFNCEPSILPLMNLDQSEQDWMQAWTTSKQRRSFVRSYGKEFMTLIIKCQFHRKWPSCIPSSHWLSRTDLEVNKHNCFTRGALGFSGRDSIPLFESVIIYIYIYIHVSCQD